MSSTAEEIELLERVLFRLGCAETDEKLEAAVQRFLTPVILKITSPHENVQAKVVEVLTHIKRRLTSRPQVQIPVEALLDQYKTAENATILQNFVIIFITMGYPRLTLEERYKLLPKIVACEEKSGATQDKFFMMILPLLGEIKLPDDRNSVLQIDKKPIIRRNFLSLMQDVLLLPYGTVQPSEHESPPGGMSVNSLKRVLVNGWTAEELEKIKKGIVRFICSDVFTDTEIFIILVLASSDTRFSVATPAISELNKVCTTLDFGDPHITYPLYNLFCGNGSQDADKKTGACSARVRQKLLQYLIKCHGNGINVPKGIQVVFEGLFGENTNHKCKVLALRFAEILVKDGSKDIVSKVSKVILTGLTKVIGKDCSEPTDVQNAAYIAFAQLARSYPSVINTDLKLVLTFFNHLANAPADLQSAIREALVSMAPAFAYTANDGKEEIVLSGHQHLLLAMLSDNAESNVHIVQNVTSVFLTTCYPDYYAPARYLLLLIAGERNSLRENINTVLYGVSRKDHINYNMLRSHGCDSIVENTETPTDGKLIELPSFKAMMQHVHEMSEKRLAKKAVTVVGNKKLPFNWNAYEEILEYLRLCLWYSSGVICQPGSMVSSYKLKEYITQYCKNVANKEVHQYMEFVQNSVEAKRSEMNLQCLYDLLYAAPDLLIKDRLHLLEPLAHSLKDVSETMRQSVAEVYGILLAHGYVNDDFDKQISECLDGLSKCSLENKHGWLLVLGHTFKWKIQIYRLEGKQQDYANWSQFVESIKVIVKMLCESQWLLVSAAVKCISMIGGSVEIPHVEVEIQIPTNKDDGGEDNDDITVYEMAKASTKSIIFSVVSNLLRSTSVRAKVREDAARCLGFLAIGDGAYFTQKNLQKFLSLVKVPKDAALNIAISDAIVYTLIGQDIHASPIMNDYQNVHCDDVAFETFLKALIRLVLEPNPHCRQAISVWLLGVVKHCSHRAAVRNSKQMLQFAFTELLSDDSEFVQDVASRGLALVYSLSNPNTQNELANSLLDQLIGGQRKVNKVDGDSELFAEGMLGKTPTGGNITTYKELCSLASDLNQPEMIYQFMQLANHNAAWTSKLGAAFGLKSLSKESKDQMKPYLGKIIPRLYRYKYDPTPKIQNSMISIWESVVSEPKEVVEQFYWEILREILDNLTFNEWRVRIACCLAVRDLLKRPSGLRLRTDDNRRAVKAATVSGDEPMDVDTVPEPELKELWSQLFRVMDDIHEGTRMAAQGTAMFLSKLCVIASSSEQGKSGVAVASSILPLLLEVGVTHMVAEIRKVSIKTISEMIDSSGALIAPHLPTLIPCLLKATGELESSKLSYLSTRLGTDHDAQETVDSLRAEAAKSHDTMETISKCIGYMDYEALEKMTPAILEMTKTSINLGTKISCAHFTCLISIRLGKVMTPLTSKYLGACFVGLKDRNATVRKYYASAVGHLVGIAKEQSIKNLFTKLQDVYFENNSNRAVALAIQAINKRHNELLRDYMECVLPLIFFAMHEEPNEENKSNIELWKELWHEICTGDAGIRQNLHVIMPQLETSLNEASWSRKAQAGNAIHNIATRLGSALETKDRLHLINLLLGSLQGRTFQGKERLLQALAALCKGLPNDHEICPLIIEAAMKECRKEEPNYRTLCLGALGIILEELDADRFEEVYQMVWHLLEKKKLRTVSDSDEASDTEKDLSADERNKRAHILNKLKETVCETLGKAWPKHSIDTQYKYQLKFAERCAECLKNNTRPVQVSLLGALTKFVERLRVFDSPAALSPEVREKKAKIEEKETRDTIIVRICSDILAAVAYASDMPHTGLKKECLNILLMLTKRLNEANDTKHLVLVKDVFEKNLAKFQKESAPEVRCRIKDMEEKLSKFNL